MRRCLPWPPNAATLARVPAARWTTLSVCLLLAPSLACNSITGASDLKPVDCLGDCRSGPGVYCFDKQCVAGESCCARKECDDAGKLCGCVTSTASCAPEAGTPLQCDGPEDCKGGFCCADLQLVEPAAGSCEVTLRGAGVTCSTSCGALAGCEKDKPPVRVCHKASDCAGEGERCCRIPTSAGILELCAQPGFASSYSCL